MICPKGWENCKICAKDKGLLNYVWGDLKDTWEYAKHGEIKFIAICLLVGFLIGHWVGLIFTFFFLKLMGNVEGGTQLYTTNREYKVEYRTCPLHENCLFTRRVVK